ncbi:PiggyBac transposable element-derived protein like [Argiope bruennichi]|uniref:PiggyBac transposable element-derived protein like n=1 Tax=Argiope bruennichi TaxID=94029 RepID=A0A8T0EUK7_ARGBR|nr:PiggyBac transposable element-derived protein like [Argiope bruennichi]
MCRESPCRELLLYRLFSLPARTSTAGSRPLHPFSAQITAPRRYEIWNALSSGSDDDFDDSDEDPTFNPNVLFNRNSEDISDNNNDSESSENEVNIQTKVRLQWRYTVTSKYFEFGTPMSVQQTPEKPLNVTSSDIRKYLGICILSSVSSVKDFRLYWNPAVGISLIQNSMPVNEFEKIRRYLHFNDNNAFSTDLQGGQDKFFKLRPLIDELQKSFLSIPMEECLCVDEQMCATKARHHLKQYMPDKPHKYGYKLFILSGVSGFAYNFEIYGGKELDVANILQEPDLGASSNVVIRLTRPVQENVNHKLYFDNYYTSIPLQVYLKKKGILSLGTIRRNRIPDCKLPTERELKLQVRGSITEFVAEYDGCELSNVSWKDNKTVTMLSTFAGTNPLAETLCLHGQVKSLKRGRPSSAEETVGKQSKKACRKEPPKDIRFDRIDHWPEHSTNKQRCKMLNCKGFTRVQCMKCSIPLCFYKREELFRDYHLQKSRTQPSSRSLLVSGPTNAEDGEWEKTKDKKRRGNVRFGELCRHLPSAVEQNKGRMTVIAWDKGFPVVQLVALF